MVRKNDEGFAWAESIVGGKIVAKPQVERWRPQWFLDIDLGGSRIERFVLRGFRNPGYTRGASDESGSRAMLATEARVLHALQAAPVATPDYFGHDEDLGWLLMEFVEGDTALTQIADADRRFSIYQGYVEELAKLHAHPIEQLDLPPELLRPTSAKHFLRTLTDRNVAFYRSLELPEAEPVLELGLQWLTHTELPSERAVCLGLTDVGPDQFLFEGSQFRCLIDFEHATLCDPLYDMGKMRSRDVTYWVGRMADHMVHYGQCYEDLTGIPLDVKALQYWTVAGPTLSNMYTVRATQRPDPTMVDLAFVYAWEVQQKRCIIEGLAEFYDFTLDPPNLPSPKATVLDPLYEALTGQFEQHYGPAAQTPDDRTFARYSMAIAETLGRGNASVALLQENLEELCDLLGHRTDDWATGMKELEAAIRDDWSHDLERRVVCLYRAEVRREFLYEPLQRATGVTHERRPLERIASATGNTT